MTVNAFLFQIKCSKCFFNLPLITVAMQLPQKYQRSPTLIIINVTEHQISILERLVKIQLCHHRNKAHYKILKIENCCLTITIIRMSVLSSCNVFAFLEVHKKRTMYTTQY